MRSTTPEPVGASESSCIHMPFCGWLVSVSNLRSQYQSWLGRSPCSLHHALWLRPLARKSSILSAHNSRSSCLASLVTRISSFPLMTSLSHQRREARRYGWFDAYRSQALPLAKRLPAIHCSCRSLGMVFHLLVDTFRHPQHQPKSYPTS